MHGNYLHFACRILYCNCQKGSRLAIARASGRKENGMEEMTDKQMEVILNLLADKFAACNNMDDVQQAIKEVREMAKKEKHAE